MSGIESNQMVIVLDADARRATRLVRAVARVPVAGVAVAATLDQCVALAADGAASLIVVGGEGDGREANATITVLRTRGIATPVVLLLEGREPDPGMLATAAQLAIGYVVVVGRVAPTVVANPTQSVAPAAARRAPDDYVGATLRRPGDMAGDGDLRAGQIRIRPLARTVHVGGEEVTLSPKEFDLLSLLVRNAGHLVTHGRMLREIWRLPEEHPTRTAHMAIATVRKKLLPYQRAGLVTIRTLHGYGYRLDVPPTPAVARTPELPASSAAGRPGVSAREAAGDRRRRPPGVGASDASAA